MMIKITKPTDGDLAKLLKDFKMRSVSEFKNDLKSKKEEMLILLINNKLSGVIKFKNLKSYSRIESFYLIQKKWRGKEIAQQLYNKYEKSLKDKKFVEAYVYLTNLRAQRFYEKNGFKKIKKTKDDSGKEMYHMKKRLKQA
jgi:ribosomal protein S18 acetylase RimI-like enzyme